MWPDIVRGLSPKITNKNNVQNNSINYKLSYEFEEIEIESIEAFTEKIKSINPKFNGAAIKFKHSSLNLKEQTIKPAEKLKDVKQKCEENILINFVSNSFQQQIEKMNEKIEHQNSKIEKLNRFTFNPILIRQLRKEAREKIFEEIGRSLIEYQKNCEYVKKLLKNNNHKELSKIKGFNENELNDLFLDSSYNFELNQVAHINLLNYKNEIYELGEFNKKLFDYVFMKYN
jgi:hypothetical protein